MPGSSVLTRERALELARKLRERARRDNGPEAAAARRQLRRLMLEHAISTHELDAKAKTRQTPVAPPRRKIPVRWGFTVLGIDVRGKFDL